MAWLAEICWRSAFSEEKEREVKGNVGEESCVEGLGGWGGGDGQRRKYDQIG